MNTEQKVLGLKVGLLLLIFASFFMTAFKVDLGFVEATTSIADLDGGGIVVFIALAGALGIGYLEYSKHNFTQKAYYIYSGLVTAYMVLEIIGQKSDDDFGILTLGIASYLLIILPALLFAVTLKGDLVTEFVEHKFPSGNNTPQRVKTNKASNNYDEIKKLKELLDMGAISQEEFDKKKSDLL